MARSAPTARRASAPSSTSHSTSPTCAVSKVHAPRSRWRPPVRITCCWSARPVSARRCSPAAFRRSCPPSTHDEALEVTKVHSAARSAPRPGAAARRAVPGPASQRVRGRPRRRRQRARASGRDLDGAPRRALPRRAARVPGCRARVVATAPRGTASCACSRASGTIEFPADFLLVACANPCPCGRGAMQCTCSDVQRARYARRLSAPLLDRFDLRLAVSPGSGERGESSCAVAARVGAAVERQRRRLRGTRWRRNAHVPAGALLRYVPLDGDARAAWHDVCTQRQLTGRGAARVRRVARTLADLDDRDTILPADVERAAALREDLW